MSFGCAQNCLAIANEIKEKSLKRLNYVLFDMLLFVVCVYLIVGNCGYFTYGSRLKNESDILKLYPKNTITALVRLCISFAVTFSYPLVCHACRKSFCFLVHEMPFF